MYDDMQVHCVYKIIYIEGSNTIQMRARYYQKRWQLSYNPFWCKLILYFLQKQLQSNISTCYCCSYSPDQYSQTEHIFKANEGLQQNRWQLNCHQIGVRLHIIFAVYVIIRPKYCIHGFCLSKQCRPG